MKKKYIGMRLDPDKLDYIDYIARRLNPDKPNRSRAISLVIDLVQGSFVDDDVINHSISVAYIDGRRLQKH